MLNEIWREIKDYSGLYEVSNLGRVRALKREVLNIHGVLQRYPEKVLTVQPSIKNNTTYYRVTLSKDAKVKRYFIHRLVASAFLSNPENKEYVNHKDNVGTNNKVSNLEWCTHSENMIHAQKQGRLFSSQAKGGKLGSKPKVQAMLRKVHSLYGSQINDWFVIPNSHFSKRTEKGNNTNYVYCTCKCGKEQAIEINRLARWEATCCNMCAQRKRNSKLKI